jgi:hypothetical protein
MHYTTLENSLLTDTGMYIPKDPSNRDYQEYLSTLPVPTSTPTEYQIAIEKKLSYEEQELLGL